MSDNNCKHCGAAIHLMHKEDGTVYLDGSTQAWFHTEGSSHYCPGAHTHAEPYSWTDLVADYAPDDGDTLDQLTTSPMPPRSTGT